MVPLQPQGSHWLLETCRTLTRGAASLIGLTDYHIDDMVFHMKTTLNIDDTVMARLRQEAATSGRTMSELVEAALRLLLQPRQPPVRSELPPLPTFDSGGHVADVADRDALFRAMAGR